MEQMLKLRLRVRMPHKVAMSLNVMIARVTWNLKCPWSKYRSFYPLHKIEILHVTHQKNCHEMLFLAILSTFIAILKLILETSNFHDF